MATQYTIIIHLCLFIMLLNSVHMKIESVAPSQVNVKQVALNVIAEGESQKQLNTSNMQVVQPVEMTRLFANVHDANNVTQNVSSTSISADLPVMEGGGKPGKPIYKDISPSATTEMTKVEVNRTEPFLKTDIKTAEPIAASVGQQNSRAEISTKEPPKLEPVTTSKSLEIMTPKIYPRKGVTFEPDPVVNTSMTSDPDSKHISVKKILIDSQKINNFIKSSNDSIEIRLGALALSNNSAIVGADVNKTINTNDTESTKDDLISNPPLRRKKPLFTTDTTTDGIEAIVLKNRKSSSQRDYVIPVVVTILTVPMIVVLGLFFYKKGHECWERRHYRRMDFLIDGIYND